jgi:transposase-like protein
MTARRPIGGVDYPRTRQEFDDWFSSEETCAAFLTRLRWADGFVCPACSGTSAWRNARRQLQCCCCQRATSPTAGTIFARTRKPLRLWLLAMWTVTSHRHGSSARSLQRALGLRSYQTAWTWLHKLRRAMVRPDRDRLCGEVEVDECYVGGNGASGQRSMVAIAAEVRGRRTGRIRLARIRSASEDELVPFICRAVCEDAVVLTDDFKGYWHVERHGYRHVVKDPSDGGDPAHVVMPRAHRVADLLNQWWLGIYEGGVRSRHLDYYLDEFTFRHNHRATRGPGLLFYCLVEQAVSAEPAPYARLVGGSKSKDRQM